MALLRSLHRIAPPASILAAALVFAAQASAKSPPSISPEARAVATSGNDLGLALLRGIHDDGKNLAFSPLGIDTAFALTSAGAKGGTLTEMQRAFGFPADAATLQRGHQVLRENLLARAKSEGFQFSSATGLWAAENHRWEAPFLDVARGAYAAKCEMVTFGAAPARTSARINQWIDKATHGKISNFISPNDLGADTRLVVVNAIHFKAQWKHEFETAMTRDEKFHRPGGESVTVRMMHGDTGTSGAEVAGAKLLSLPYRGDLEMVLILPGERDGLAALEKTLTPRRLSTWLAKMKPLDESDVALPRFHTATQLDKLPSLLAKLGVKQAFDPKAADFRGLDGRCSEDGGLYISQAMQAATITVDEHGTEAAAAAAVIAEIRAGPPDSKAKPFVFHADHPFLFIVRDTQSGAILFLGHINDPRS
jgi:serpin B